MSIAAIAVASVVLIDVLLLALLRGLTIRRRRAECVDELERRP